MKVPWFFRGQAQALHDHKLSPSDRIVLFDMALQAWMGNTCRISQERIAERIGISKRQVQRSQSRLQDLLYITAIDEQDHKVTTYRLNSRLYLPKKTRSTGDIMSLDRKRSDDIMSSLLRQKRQAPIQ